MQKSASTSCANRPHNELREEVVLLRDWDIEKFFPKKKSAEGSGGAAVGAAAATDYQQPGGVASLTRLSSSNTSTLKADSKLQRCSMAEMPSSGRQPQAAQQQLPKGFQPLKSNAGANSQQTKEQKSSSNSASTTSSSSSSNSSTSALTRSAKLPIATKTNAAATPPCSASNNKSSNPTHKRQESDSKLPQNFIRGFRRENSDFFPLTKRHSAVLVNTSLLQQQQQQSSAGGAQLRQQQPFGSAAQRASAMIPRNSIYNKQDAKDAAKTANSSNAKTANTAAATKPTTQPNKTSWTSNLTPDFLRPRREKTESVIVFQNSAARQQLFAQQLVQQQQQQLQQQKQQVNHKLFLQKKKEIHSQKFQNLNEK